MNKKEERQNAIRNIISSGNIENQDDLLKELQIAGYELTQATLSRDLKAMQVTKTPSGNGYQYILPESELSNTAVNQASMGYLADRFHSLDFSANIAVIKTRPAFASGIASAIDSAHMPEVLGSVAGDDTIFLVMREGLSQEELKLALIRIIPLLKEKLM